MPYQEFISTAFDVYIIIKKLCSFIYKEQKQKTQNTKQLQTNKPKPQKTK